MVRLFLVKSKIYCYPIDMFSKELIQQTILTIEKASKENNCDLFSKTRDIFQARLDTYISRTHRYLESAVIGELGNNTFDHNLDYDAHHLRGAYFSYNENGNFIVLADFGEGVRKTISRVKFVSDDLEALKLVFTEHISSRSLENRGNGLKFVSESIIEYNWQLYFQSGTAVCSIDKNGMSFYNYDIDIIGCLAILDFSGN